MTGTELNEKLKERKKALCLRFVKAFYDGKEINLPDGSLLVDGKPKTKYSGIGCMHAIATPAYVQGFDDGVDTLLDFLESSIK